MESSPVSKNSKMEVDLCTPTENLKKHCQEITPDNPIQPEKRPLLAAKKVSAVRISQTFSKRKLFGQAVDQTSENENESILKKKKSDNAHIIDNTQKRLLTERQQLAFLLEATSTRESAENENESTFTKIATRKKAKRNGKSANPRVYRRNERGETLLHVAAIKADIASLKKLLKDGAEVGLKDYAGWTALHEACNHGNLEAAKLLIKHGAEVNVPGFEGDTPLHDAVVNNHVEVVNMLLSCDANPHQTNGKRKKPTDLISSKEMNDIFHLHGVEDTAFEKTNIKILCEESTALASAEKKYHSDTERSHVVRGSILGNEIQRKETQGESKMEKPVMYICKLQPRNEEVTIRTTHVTSYKECSNDDGGSESKNSDYKGGEKSGLKPGILMKNIFAIDKENETSQVRTSPEDLHKVEEVIPKDEASSLQVESHGQFEILEKTNVSMNASDGVKTAAKETEDKVISSSDQDKVKVKTPSCENKNLSLKAPELAENKQVSIQIEKAGPNDCEENTQCEGDKKGQSSNTPASNNPPAESLEKNVERSRTPEIDESIAVEVLSTGLFSGAPGFSQYCSPLEQQDRTMTTPSFIRGDVSSYTSGGQRSGALTSPRYKDPSDVQPLLVEGSVEQIIVEQSSFPNSEPFLDVEGFETDLKVNLAEVNLEGKDASSKQLKEQENVISSTSNYNDCTQTYLSNSHVEKSLANQGENSSMSEKKYLNTGSEQTAILDHASEMENTPLTSWKFHDTISEKDSDRNGKAMVSKNGGYTEQTVNRTRMIRGEHDGDGFQAWQLQTKAPKRKKVGLKNSSFTKEDKISRRKPGQTSGNHDKISSWDTRTTTGLQRNSQSSNENTSLVHSVTTTVVKPSKPTVTWQALMAAGRCQLNELVVPGYNQFLMKTKEYELATNVTLEKSTEAPTQPREVDIALKLERSKEELLRKQRSEQDKLQLCMEQEIVRFYSRKAYSSLNCNQPPGVCTAIHWQNMSPRQLENEKKRLSQKLHMERDETSSSHHQEIIEKYEKLKSVMARRHQHEQQALDAVTKSELRKY